ncbi:MULTISPECIES: hypothetical protein [Actinosynnema]|uniref:Uncharacterized protein n=1 Tax=Actinosynnema pretiosum TaxID=42197 RepID=A0A290ZGE7_9PSEU|nr:hypothetical protein [Actinosynnema pretiosum]ATE58049.1 hypothetical protein CNX65_07915 [Actinosynnema pretiosum]
MTEQRRSKPSELELDLIRRIQNLAHRAEVTAHSRSNLVGPPPSQEHLDILAEIRALTELAVEEQVVGRPRSTVPPQAPRPVEESLGGTTRTLV